MKRRTLISMSFITIIAMLLIASQAFAAVTYTPANTIPLYLKGTTQVVGSATGVSTTHPTATVKIKVSPDYSGYNVQFGVKIGRSWTTIMGFINSSGFVELTLAIPKKAKGPSLPGTIQIFPSSGTAVTSDTGAPGSGFSVNW